MSNQIIRDIGRQLECMTTKTQQLLELVRQRHESPPEPRKGTPVGRFAYRIEYNDFERIAAEHWAQEDKAFHILDFLMGDGQEPGLVTERDRVVIATFTQWLGSNVGRGWLRELVAKFDAEAK
jgi:hypothetical protein